MSEKFNPAEHLINLRGGQYMEVKWRLVWFRAEHPAGQIDTEIVSAAPLVIRATVYDGEGHKLATGHAGAPANKGQQVWTGREYEKAETAAIGRALAHAGYGTQFAGQDMDDTDYLADSPIEPPARAVSKPPTPPRQQPAAPDPLVAAAGELGGQTSPADNGGAEGAPGVLLSPARRPKLIERIVGEIGGNADGVRKRLVELEADGVLHAAMTDNEVMTIIVKRAQKSKASPKA